MRRSLTPLFLISASATGVETALTRYFALSKYSEYGYWVISIVMVGLALSGVVMALMRPWALRNAAAILRFLPIAALVAGGFGYRFVTTNPFNPLQLQNSVTWADQLGNIGLYYLDLLPFFFLIGTFISLTFMTNETRIGRVYAADLLGAGCGAALVVVLAFVLPPFRLVPILLIPIGLCCLFDRPLIIFTLFALSGVESMLILDDQASINESKPVYAPLHTQGSRVLAEIPNPRGLYQLLDDFTERADVDVSNDAGLMKIPGPPRTYGLYRDGIRIAALPRAGAGPASYAPALLSALPYILRRHANVLLIGSGGGYRIREAQALGAGRAQVLEPDPILRAAIRHGLTASPALDLPPGTHLAQASPLGAARLGARFNIIDISSDFLDQSDANQAAYTREAIAADIALLAPDGILSIPVSIRDFPAYALRVLATARAALKVPDPAAHIAVYRSAWNVRILVSRAPWTAAELRTLAKFCDDRSFDVVYYKGFDYLGARPNIYNDLPPVSFATGEVDNSVSPNDALANEATLLMANRSPPSATDFDLRPITLDRPAYYDLLRLSHLQTILRRLEILPQPEIAQLVNVAVLIQAGILALLVLCVPLFAPFFAARPQNRAPLRLLPCVVAFSALGLGYLFIEIALIDRAGFYLADRTLAFALVLTAMLIFSGLGSLLAERTPAHGLPIIAGLVALWCLAAAFTEQPVLLATIDWPLVAKLLLLIAIIAPVSLILGMPFPLLLSRSGVAGSWFLPWAWGLNGAMSVVATPLANLIALIIGFRTVLLCAAMLYVCCIVAHPTRRLARKNPS